MNAGGKGKSRDCRGENVHQSQSGMLGHQVTAAFLAILTLAEGSLLECCDVLGPGFDLHCFRLPETEGIYRPAGPRATRTAMTIAHALGRSSDLNLNCAAKTFSNVAHAFSLPGWSRCIRKARSSLSTSNHGHRHANHSAIDLYWAVQPPSTTRLAPVVNWVCRWPGK